MRTGWRAVLGLVGFVAVCLGVGALGSIATAMSLDTWYQELNRPAFTPPSAVFPIAWTTLYVAMGVAAWRVWARDGFAKGRVPLGLFAIQLVLNGAWSWLFFAARSPVLGLVGIVLLDVAAVATTIAFARRSRLALALMIPYVLWLAYATALNAGFVIANA